MNDKITLFIKSLGWTSDWESHNDVNVIEGVSEYTIKGQNQWEYRHTLGSPAGAECQHRWGGKKNVELHDSNANDFQLDQASRRSNCYVDYTY